MLYPAELRGHHVFQCATDALHVGLGSQAHRRHTPIPGRLSRPGNGRGQRSFNGAGPRCRHAQPIPEAQSGGAPTPGGTQRRHSDGGRNSESYRKDEFGGWIRDLFKTLQ
jgi:hypothetical protein